MPTDRSSSSAADATSHLFFAYLRSISPDSPRGMSGIATLPIALQNLVQATEYPPETPELLQVSTAKVVMIVDTVSPTPFALLRRAKNFEYRDSDRHLQEFAGFEDPIQALTDECLRVLQRVASGHQTELPNEKTPSDQDQSWSRFEDIGFGNTLESDLDDHAAQTDFSGGLKSAPQSSTGDLGRPTTPSWADFMSSGFSGDETILKAPVAPLLLPPDKVLPPLSTGRGQSSQSHKRALDSQSDDLEPGELASIANLDLDDSFWWVWISSLAGEEPATRKAVFGRCALIETIIKGAKWLVLEEQVRGAASEPDPGAYIAEKKRFFGLSTRMGKLSRRKSSARRVTPVEESYHRIDNSAPQSKTSIGSDQHARIQAAAAALQKKNREQSRETTSNDVSKADTSGGGGGGGGAAQSSGGKTNSILNLQPAILSEASQALKWAKNYDKDAFRAAYLGDSHAGKGEGLSTDSLKPQSVDKPTTPVSEAPSTNTTVPPVPSEPVDTATPGSPDGAPVSISKDEVPAADQPKSSRPVSTVSSTPASPPQPNLSTDSTAEETGKKLKKKPGATGFKSMFGKKKSEPEGKPPMKPTGAEASAVAAACAALESKAKASQEAPTHTPPRSSNGPSVLRKKPVGEGPKPSSAASAREVSSSAHGPLPEPVAEESIPELVAPVTTEVEKPTSPEVVEITKNEQAAKPSSEPTENGSSPATVETDDHLSRVDTLEQAAADREFSRFDQGPLVEQPAFSPESPVSPVSEKSSAFTDEEPPKTSLDAKVVKPASFNPTHDRWAQIRKNATERAAQVQAEARVGEGPRPDYGGGDLSAEGE